MHAMTMLDNFLASRWTLLGVIVLACVLPLALCKWHDRKGRQ